MKKRLIIIVALLFAATAGLLVYGLASALRDKPSINNKSIVETEVPTTYQDPQLVAALESVGYKDKDLSGINLRYGESSEITDVCGWERAGACYSPGMDSIIVSNNRTGDDLRRSVAHEYLHYMWDKHDLDDDKELKSLQRTIFDTNKDVENRIDEFYSGISADIDTELFSYLCTEFKNQIRDNYVGRNCSQYIDIESLPTRY